MSIYLEKMKELTLLLPENKTLYFRNMSVYNKANEDVKQALDKNVDSLQHMQLPSLGFTLVLKNRESSSIQKKRSSTFK